MKRDVVLRGKRTHLSPTYGRYAPGWAATGETASELPNILKLQHHSPVTQRLHRVFDQWQANQRWADRKTMTESRDLQRIQRVHTVDQTRTFRAAVWGVILGGALFTAMNVLMTWSLR